MSDDARRFWEERYGDAQVWSGRPNAALVAAVSDLVPGRALDLGCGEGGDSIWLAERGWQVTGVDISHNAIVRASAEAERRLGEGRITWLVADLTQWRPEGTYDLVAACFLHSPLELARTEILGRGASAVARGGHLLVVGHVAFPPWAQALDHEGHHDHHFLGPEEELEALELGEGWEPLVIERRSREALGPHGEHATLEDSIVFVRRR